MWNRNVRGMVDSRQKAYLERLAHCIHAEGILRSRTGRSLLLLPAGRIVPRQRVTCWRDAHTPHQSTRVGPVAVAIYVAKGRRCCILDEENEQC